ncbi:hypothetical protein CHS0354_033979 [Potamilus streckersoni]|uniref:RING-type domain-containing protein n=1 Tax=Potamilus streckersoni TaxID=2493646 RepID=A0AAE0WA14_9BIVA|nr:hypothetical protein CHS0354_033979 [Potamilus streckersoni]
MTSVGIQCNIEHAISDSSSASQSVKIHAKNKLLHNGDSELVKSDLVNALHRSVADGMSLSQTFAEIGETSDRAKQLQDSSQEAMINSKHSNPIVASEHIGEENASRQIVVKKDSANVKTEKQKPCAVVAPFVSDTETSDKEETVLKMPSVGDGEDMGIVSNPNMQHAIVGQQQESEQIKDNVEEINLAQNSTEPCLLHRRCFLPPMELTQVRGDTSLEISVNGKLNDEYENCSLDGAFTGVNCSVQSYYITKTDMVPEGSELNGNESTHDDKIAKDFGDEESFNIYQNEKLNLIQIRTSKNILNANDLKGQKYLSNREHFTERYRRKNRKTRISISHSVHLRKPLHKARLAAKTSEKNCKCHAKKKQIKGKYGLGNNIPPKGDKHTVKVKIRGNNGLKDTKKGKSVSRKESLNRTYLRHTRDQLMETNGTDISSKPESLVKARQRSCRLKKTPLKKIGNKRDIQEQFNNESKRSKENKAAYVRVNNKDNIQSKSGQTKKLISINDNLIIQVKKNVYVFFNLGYKPGTKTTNDWHNLYSSILQCVILDLGSIPLVQIIVAPGSELINCINFENEARRRQTFRAYDNQDIVERLVRNGFFYSERENQIVCYRCGGRHGRLRDGDIPERAHRSGCQFYSETDPGNHTVIPERLRNRSMRDNVRLQGSSNSIQTSPSWYMVNGRHEQCPRVALSNSTVERYHGEVHSVPGRRVNHHLLQTFIDYFRRQNDPRGARGGRPMTVIPPFPFDEAHEHRRHITVLPPRPHMNGGRHGRGITALLPRAQPHQSVSPADGAVIRPQCAEAISTPSMPILIQHRCIFCRRRPVSIRFEPCQHAISCYQCSVRKVTCTQCGKNISQKSFM